ncbi:hypothetical protein FH972_025385 [Carpinus fangiana]|uniref:C2H2-type domain-containing protein n=1 Tax=Carpinus fangiana TaxID=176857 RepID=A0A5N6L1V8_9ROSI|nr:hypothetical protein FH972_025385 [Carpinus fangiana]
MAEHGWNLRHRINMQHGSTNHIARQEPFQSPTQIACRLCDQVFMSTQALINHIESHMAEEESTAASRSRQHRATTTRLPSQRDLLFNCSQPNFATHPENRLPLVQRPSQPSERHPFLCVHRSFAPPPPPTLLPQVSPMARFSSHAPQLILSSPQGQRRVLAPEEPLGDCTKPYLDQLEHPIMVVVQAADRNDENSGIFGLNKLDLALKL